jgi:hypothetical protein
MRGASHTQLSFDEIRLYGSGKRIENRVKNLIRERELGSRKIFIIEYMINLSGERN